MLRQQHRRASVAAGRAQGNSIDGPLLLLAER
jgi:hypothetical protein